MTDPKPDVVFLVIDEPDGYNRQHFWAFWPAYVGVRMDEWGVRGQYFHAVLQTHVDQQPVDGRQQVKQVLYLKQLQRRYPQMHEGTAIRHCEDLVRTEKSA